MPKRFNEFSYDAEVCGMPPCRYWFQVADYDKKSFYITGVYKLDGHGGAHRFERPTPKGVRECVAKMILTQCDFDALRQREYYDTVDFKRSV